MELVSNWKAILTKAWTVRLLGVGIGAEVILQYFADGLPQWAIIGLLVVTFGSRFVAQEGLSKPEASDADQ